MAYETIRENIERLKVRLFELLKEKNLKISTAESCTGGMMGACLTSIPGISEYYGFGFVTYSNEAKQKLIGVRKETLEEYGAVSAQTAMEMAEGAQAVSRADIAVSATGIAGPGGGSAEKKVGLVYIGCAIGTKRLFRRLNLDGDRETVRLKTIENILNMVINEIEK